MLCRILAGWWGWRKKLHPFIICPPPSSGATTDVFPTVFDTDSSGLGSVGAVGDATFYFLFLLFGWWCWIIGGGSVIDSFDWLTEFEIIIQPSRQKILLLLLLFIKLIRHPIFYFFCCTFFKASRSTWYVFGQISSVQWLFIICQMILHDSSSLLPAYTTPIRSLFQCIQQRLLR